MRNATVTVPASYLDDGPLTHTVRMLVLDKDSTPHQYTTDITVRNVAPVAAIPEIEELNIGHSIVSRAVFVGIEASVREMRRAIGAARS